MVLHAMGKLNGTATQQGLIPVAKAILPSRRSII
jgi:hypothetical protein